MGGSISGTVFGSKYEKERAALRKALILSFIGNPENQSILRRIEAVKSLIVQHPEYCSTAAREASNTFDYSPTNIEAAEHELDRLFTIYETNTILRSVNCRIGPVACPLGHYAPYFGDPQQHPMSGGKKRKIICSLCNKNTSSGHHCSYCSYNLCMICAPVYCNEGHKMKLWTHPEAQHSCMVCNKFPITSGYRCGVCIDYDICDLCTARPGRKQVQQIIIDRMAEYLKYMEDHKAESETANKTLAYHRKTVATNTYSSTAEMYVFEQSLASVIRICEEEVLQTRRMQEVLRLRKIITVGAELGLSVTATAESTVTGRYTDEEIARLRILSDWIERESSVVVRSQHVVACPLGHSMRPFKGQPSIYLRRDNVIAARKKGKNKPICKICDRVAQPEGFNCEFCEYDLCTTCSVIYCTEGHAMKMWTVPEAMDVTCYVCNAKNLSSGYGCSICNEFVCDLSTSKAARGHLREKWDKEMKELIAFMNSKKYLSSVAMYYHWRHDNYIVSVALLTEYVRELRTAKQQVEAQIDQKPIIDQIKEYRKIIAKDVYYCATAIRETDKPQHYIFRNKKAAWKEAYRLQKLIDYGISLQSVEHRQKCGVACPLGHGMGRIESLKPFEPLPSYIPSLETNESKLFLTSSPNIDATSSPQTPLALTNSSSTTIPVDNSTSTHPESTSSRELYLLADEYIDNSHSKRSCKVCDVDNLYDGYTCNLCEYDLCLDCSTIYCRLGHALQIWTMPYAETLVCDMCKISPISRGYRCTVCNTDVCDICTSRDARNAFIMWPKKELNRTLKHLVSLGQDSMIAEAFLKEESPDKKRPYKESMSVVCRRLKEAQEMVQHSEEEIRLRKEKLHAKKYGLSAIDM